MNYFAHAAPFLDQPYFMAATGIPDWLAVCDRAVRVRQKLLVPFLDDADPVALAVARGTQQHLRDDRRFHETRAFGELVAGLSGVLRGLLGGEGGFRPSFLAHLLVELLLDATLIAEAPERLDRYYAVLDTVDAARVEAAINRMVPHPTARLAWMIDVFRQHRILYDYLEDVKLLARLNQVMRRVGFEPLPECVLGSLPEARREVAARRAELLDGIPA